MPVTPAEQELWRRYQEDGDVEARDFLFVRYSSWARQVAASVYRRLRVAQIDWEDYVQNAQMGLLEAMSRFDATRGIEFFAYAKPRVRGAVFNGLRLQLREDEQRRSLVDHRFERLRSLSESVSDDPLDDFIDSVIGLGLGHLLETEQFGASPEQAQTLLERHELGTLLGDVLLSLKERERHVLMSHYLRFVPFNDIAKELGLTKGRISQIHKSALMAMREELARRRYDYSSL